MNSALLPRGFRFHPTDEELVGYYLKRKNDGLNIELETNRFFRKETLSGSSSARATASTPTDRAATEPPPPATGKPLAKTGESPASLRRIFYLGRAPGGERTGWLMHEYRLWRDLLLGTPDFVGDFALCRIVKRNGNLVNSADKKCTPFSMLESGRKRSFDGPFDGAGEEGSSLSLPSSHVLPELGREIEPTMATFLEDGFPRLSSDVFPAASHHFSTLSAMNSLQEEASLQNNYQASEFWYDPTLQYLDAPDPGAEAFNPATMVSPPICRQARSQGEEVNLWLQEDIMVTVM